MEWNQQVKENVMALNEGVVKQCECVLADSKGVELPQEILPLLAYPGLLCIVSTFQKVIEDCEENQLKCVGGRRRCY